MQELADTAKDDDAERAILAHRQQRLAEDAQEARKARFGRVYPIARDDYTREVTEASSVNEEDGENEQGTGVVCFLYKDGIERSDIAKMQVQTLAARHPRTKFVSIVGDKCIPNLPDSRIPMFIVYRKGEIRHQMVSWGADRLRRIEELEAVLVACGAILPPKESRNTSRRRDSDDEEDDDEDYAAGRSSRMRSAATSTNGRTQKNIRRGGGDSDSDFDFDL
ncbi:hypothetical protein AX16_002945 [Volvariella volvacea WC 439]|nr:hypothetical protein AX16_002945 [Volvariella volvacea WC 439]